VVVRVVAQPHGRGVIYYRPPDACGPPASVPFSW